MDGADPPLKRQMLRACRCKGDHQEPARRSAGRSNGRLGAAGAPSQRQRAERRCTEQDVRSALSAAAPAASAAAVGLAAEADAAAADGHRQPIKAEAAHDSEAAVAAAGGARHAAEDVR